MEYPVFDKNNLNWDEYKNKLWLYFKSRIPRFPKEKLDLIRKAYNLAFESHKNVFRKGGNKDPYITHPVEVAIIVANELRFGASSIAAALLHDCLEDVPEINKEFLALAFGKEITTIVDGVTKITQVSGKEESKQFGTFKKMILTIPQDFRTFLIKMADRLHNMRTMDDMPEVSQRIKSSENLYLYSKMAAIAGFWKVKLELEDRSFSYLYPEEYDRLKNLRLIEDKKNYQKVEKIKNEIAQIIENIDESFKFEIVERKSLYKVWLQMNKYNVEYSDIYNRYALRIIMDVPLKFSRMRSYKIYLALSDKMKISKLKDHYILKKTIFRALVFDVETTDANIEVQIMSKTDSDISTYGSLAEKKNYSGLEFLRDKINEYKTITNDNDEDFDIKEIFENIYVKTPKGDIINLPVNSCVLDFAFKIHTNLGIKCIGAKSSNHKPLTPTDKLESGMTLEILTSKNAKPQLEWIDIVATNRAKNALSKYFSKELKEDKNTNISIPKIEKNKVIIVDDKTEYTLAACCNPMIGDNAMGHIHQGKLIIHNKDCKEFINISATDSANIGLINWKHINEKTGFVSKIHFEGIDRMGIIRDVVNIITNELKVNMNKIEVENYSGTFIGKIELFVKNKKTLDQIIRNISQIENITNIYSD